MSKEFHASDGRNNNSTEYVDKVPNNTSNGFKYGYVVVMTVADDPEMSIPEETTYGTMTERYDVFGRRFSTKTVTLVVDARTCRLEETTTSASLYVYMST